MKTIYENAQLKNVSRLRLPHLNRLDQRWEPNKFPIALTKSAKTLSPFFFQQFEWLSADFLLGLFNAAS
jgi:hypothetical protein